MRISLGMIACLVVLVFGGSTGLMDGWVAPEPIGPKSAKPEEVTVLDNGNARVLRAQPLEAPRLHESYHKLSGMVVRRFKDQRAFEFLVSQPRFRRWLLEDLRSFEEEKNYGRADELRRMAAIDRLEDLLKFGKESAQEALFDDIKNLLMEGANLRDRRLQKSLVGDQIEILSLYRRYRPEDFRELATLIEAKGASGVKYALKVSAPEESGDY